MEESNKYVCLLQLDVRELLRKYMQLTSEVTDVISKYVICPRVDYYCGGTQARGRTRNRTVTSALADDISE